MNAPVPVQDLPFRSTSLGRSVRARLQFLKSGSKTYLADQHTPHPFHITRPFSISGDPEGMATLYLQSSAGGLYHDDDHHLSVEVEDRAFAHVTSQASTIIHNSHQSGSRVDVELKVGESSWLEFCPEPAILFPGARLKSTLTAHVHPKSRLLFCDAQLCHDPEGGRATFRELDNTISLSRSDGDVFYIDHALVSGGDWFGATDGHRCAGTFLVYDTDCAARISSALEGCIAGFDASNVYAGQTHLADRSVVVVRLLTSTGAHLTEAMQAIWSAIRVAVTGKVPMPRRK
ncbi:urease accessory protein UreD [Hoeflea sp.]|uniref:urease accessory protein UreD n=1 Tax=Hoeflea sp. TaxID=1940281 RepID=UPI003BB0DCCC